MKRFRFSILPLFFISLAAAATAQGEQAAIPDRKAAGQFPAYLDQRVPALMSTYDIPGVIIALVEKGQTSWSGAYGYADLAGRRRMTTDTYCRMESISKSVTAWGVLHLVEQGLLDLDAPVGPYLKPWTFPPAGIPAEGITVRQLLSHNAGLPLGTIGIRYAPNASRPSLEEALARDAVPLGLPGQSFSYSNTGFNLLELLIESVSGRDFAEYMREEILLPLGMKHADFDWRESFDPPVPFGYDLQGQPLPVYVYPERASGGLFARVDDIAAFIAAGMPENSRGLKVLRPESIEMLYHPEVKIGGAYGLVFAAYGLGHFIEWLPTGEKSVAHGGQGSGWMTHFQSVPATGDGIIILTNSQRSWPFFGHILNDWAAWAGYRATGMGRIVMASRVLGALTGLLFLAAIWRLAQLGRGLAAGRRRCHPLAREGRLGRLGQAGTAILIGSLLLWGANQEYLFFAAAFPVVTPWLAAALLLATLALATGASLPKIAE